jgi:cytoskeletal protein CcmA (bactofilin family)
MFKQENRGNNKEAETVIGPSVMVKGNLASSGNIVIEGILKGSVKTAGEAFVGDQANITADIEAKAARIGGEVRGNIKIEGHLQIAASAKIFGDIECASLTVENGAVINGKCTMSKDLKPAKETGKEEAAPETEEEK